MPTRFWIALSLLVAAGADVAAQAPECVSVKGALLARKADGGWQPLAAGDKVPFDRRLVSLFDSELRSANGAVDVRLRGGVGEFGPLPNFESAVTVEDNPKVDLDLTLERGVVVLTNARKEGPAKVELQIRGKTLAVTLREPGTKLGIDVYARHAPGLPSIEADEPTYFVFMLNAKGSVEIHHLDKQVALSAPPGPALLRWDSAFQNLDIEHLKELPDWVQPTPEEVKFQARINELAKPLGEGKAALTFGKMLFSDDPLERKVAMTAVAALGSPAPVFAVLQQSKHADTRQYAILVLRNWLGHESGQIKKVQDAASKLGLSKTAVESMLHLLLGFNEQERRLPATYQLLIEGLNHSRLPVRELSYWHLVHLVPEGQKIAYDAAGPVDQREAAIAAWRKLVPPGQIPGQSATK